MQCRNNKRRLCPGVEACGRLCANLEWPTFWGEEPEARRFAREEMRRRRGEVRPNFYLSSPIGGSVIRYSPFPRWFIEDLMSGDERRLRLALEHIRREVEGWSIEEMYAR